MTDPILEHDHRLRLVVERLISVYRPERIYLFGSIARGDADEDSDYDRCRFMISSGARVHETSCLTVHSRLGGL